jgi:isocitrate dehydrogenase
VESGAMTKDLAMLVGPDQSWLTTEEFLATLDANLSARLST